eukprot:12401907-Karenia_brevis.AAC.1
MVSVKACEAEESTEACLMQAKIDDWEQSIFNFLKGEFEEGSSREAMLGLLDCHELNDGQKGAWQGYVDIAWFHMKLLGLATRTTLASMSSGSSSAASSSQDLLSTAVTHRAEDYGVIATHDALSERQPVNPKCLPEDAAIPVPPDGHCLEYCCLAAMNLTAFRNLPQTEAGWFQLAEDGSMMRSLARQFRQRVIQHATNAQRTDVVKSLRTDLPADAALRFYAAELGGSILVSQAYADPVDYPPMLHGDGPLVMHVYVHNHGRGAGSNHFELVQSWMEQPEHAEDASDSDEQPMSGSDVESNMKKRKGGA